MDCRCGWSSSEKQSYPDTHTNTLRREENHKPMQAVCKGQNSEVCNTFDGIKKNLHLLHNENTQGTFIDLRRMRHFPSSLTKVILFLGIALNCFIWLWWGPAGTWKPTCCFLERSCNYLWASLLLDYCRKLILKSWNPSSTLQQRCKEYAQIHTLFSSCTHIHLTDVCAATHRCAHHTRYHTNTKAQRPTA